MASLTGGLGAHYLLEIDLTSNLGRSRSATISDVAERAGVSRATVSRHLNGRPTRNSAAVALAITELAYVPSTVARSLKSGKTRSIGVVVPDITNPFFAAVVKGVESSSREREYNVLLCDTEESEQRQDRVLTALRGAIDALILAPVVESPGTPDSVRALNVPVVLFDREFAGAPVFDSVIVDNEGGAGQAARYLHQLGHRRIGVVSGPLTTTPGRTRHEGFLRALHALGEEPGAALIRFGDFGELSGYVATKTLLGLSPPPTALFVANNLMAMGALRAIKELNLRLPDDLSFVSFDDLYFGHLLEPSITTITRPAVEQGSLAMSLLEGRLNGSSPDEPRRCVLETRLSVRDSCGPARVRSSHLLGDVRP